MVIYHWVKDATKQPSVGLCGQRDWGIVELSDTVEAHTLAMLTARINCKRCRDLKSLHDLARTEL